MQNQPNMGLLLVHFACGLIDKAPDFGSGDCRFKSCHARNENLIFTCFYWWLMIVEFTLDFVSRYRQLPLCQHMNPWLFDNNKSLGWITPLLNNSYFQRDSLDEIDNNKNFIVLIPLIGSCIIWTRIWHNKIWQGTILSI